MIQTVENEIILFQRMKKIVIDTIRESGLDPDIIDPRAIEDFTTYLKLFCGSEITMQELSELIESHSEVKTAFASMTEL